MSQMTKPQVDLFLFHLEGKRDVAVISAHLIKCHGCWTIEEIGRQIANHQHNTLAHTRTQTFHDNNLYLHEWIRDNIENIEKSKSMLKMDVS